MPTTKKATSRSALLRYRLIRQAFIKRGRTMISLARELNVSRSLVTMVARGQRRQERVQNALAAVVGIKRSDLWK